MSGVRISSPVDRPRVPEINLLRQDNNLMAMLEPTGERLKYGSNPHQHAKVLMITSPKDTGMEPWAYRVVKGSDLGVTNLEDLEGGGNLVIEFKRPAAAIIKHGTPCGVAEAETIEDAVRKALETDVDSKYGCALVINRSATLGVIDVLHQTHTFVDVFFAPGIPNTPEFMKRLETRPKMKVVAVVLPEFGKPRTEMKSAAGRIIAQEVDQRILQPEELKHVAGPQLPVDQIFESISFAWSTVRHVKSNAIVLAQGTSTVGIGGGQTSRVKAVKDAVEIAGDRAKGSVLASDAFFPFSDSVEVAANAGVKIIVQSGGSIRDSDSIEAANKHGITMYFTGWRAFRH